MRHGIKARILSLRRDRPMRAGSRKKRLPEAAESGGEKEMESKKGNSKVIIGAVVLVAVAAILAIVYMAFREKPVEGAKAITIEVTGKSGETEKYQLNTDAQYLRQAMEEAEGLTFSGTESDYGMMVETVNGDLADYNADGAYWGFFVNGEYCNYGIDTQPVEDGDVFGIVYTTDSAE